MLEEVKMSVGAAAAAAILLLVTPAKAGIADWYLSPAHADIGGWLGLLGGEADAALYTADDPGRTGITGAALAKGRLQRVFDNGWTVALHTGFEVWHDRLSGGRYGNDFVQTIYASVLMKYGRFELGQEAGAAYRLATTGPLVADAPALDDATMTFFKTPDGMAFADVFHVRTAVFASGNFAKISYYTPRVFGIELGASYTPHMAKDVLPFLSNTHAANAQENILEGAANYETHLSAWTLRAYAGLALAHNRARTPGHGNLYDGAIGGGVQYHFGEETLALGGAYRQSNGYAFEPGDAYAHGQTHAVHLSSRLVTGPWKFGLEYSDGVADREGTRPHLDFEGYEAAVGYVVNSNLQMTAGFQHLDVRSSAAFYDGKTHVPMNAGFLYLYFHV